MYEQDITERSAEKPLAPRAKQPKPAQPQLKTQASPVQFKHKSIEARRLHSLLMGYWQLELDRQADNRREMELDEEFYDNHQWREEDAGVLDERGQMPLAYNVIATTVDWICGTEKRGRTDQRILPRRKADGKTAERKSQLFKYLADVNRTQFNVSRAFEDAIKVGVGWVDDGVDLESDGEEIFSRYESWRNVLWDSTAIAPDLEDARYIMRSRWVDLDMALSLFPKEKEALMRAAGLPQVQMNVNSDDVMDRTEDQFQHEPLTSIYTAKRERLQIIECWFKRPTLTERFLDGPFKGEYFDPSSRGHVQAQADGARLKAKVTMRMHVALMTEHDFLWLSISPYRHNRFPLTPVWGHMRGKTRLPYGVIRRLRDIQEDINKRASKALHILSTNRVIMDEGALGDDMDIDEFLDEVSRPDAVITKKAGKELTINNDRDLSQYQLELMSRGISMIQSASGVTDENLGRRTNATSGIAIQARQDQGALATAKYFDNLAYFQQVRGEKVLSLIEQYMDAEKEFRITNERGTPQYIAVNDNDPDNDIVRSKADFIIIDEDFHASTRQAAAAHLMELIKTLPPQIALTMLDLVVDNLDVKNREEIVKRIRQATGQRDPDSEEITPEEEKAMQAASQQQALQMAAQQAEVQKKAADAALQIAKARSELAKTTGANVEAIQKALEAAQLSLLNPAASDVADYVLTEAGFKSAADLARESAAAMAPPGAPQPGGEPPANTNPVPEPERQQVA